MADDTYRPPGIEERTPVSDPLNTLSQSESQVPTPVWRATGGDDAR
jgi:hypothetical protein